MIFEVIYPLLFPVALWLFCLSLWRHYINNLKDSNSRLPLPPGTVGLPYIGETVQMIYQGWKFYKTRKEKYGHIYKTHVMGKPTIRVWGTENIQQILKNEEKLLTMSWPKSAVDIIGRCSLMASTRRDHNTRRGYISKAFTANAVQGYSERIEPIIKRWIEKQCDSCDVIQTLFEAKKLSLEASASALLGIQCNTQQINTLMSNMDVMISNFFTLPVNLPGTGYHQAMLAREQVLQVIRDIIRERRNTSDLQQHNVLSALLVQVDAGEISVKEVEDSLIEGLFSSQNGLPSLCCSTLVHLAKHTQVVSKLHEELTGAGAMQPDTCLTLDVLKDLPYLEQVWKEITRISPPFGGGFREVIKTFELEGYQIPAGWTVLYSIRDNHQTEENFHLHADFNPDRWQNVKSNSSWIPFGGNGIRSCVGQRYTTMFLQQFIATAVKYSQWEIHDNNPKFQQFPVLLPRHQLPVVFHRRKPDGSE